MSAVEPLLPTGRFSHILLATECSEFSRSAEELAIALALSFGGRVTVMHMVVSNPEYDTLAIDLVKQHETEAWQSLDMVRARLEGQGISCTVLVKRGIHPHQEIIEAATEIRADLVIMGRRGRRGLARLMVGDATARVVAQSPCKVLVVPRGATLWKKTILLATDGSRYSDRAGVVATILAKQFGLPLRVISVVESKSRVNRLATAVGAVERVVAHASDAGVPVTGEVVEGYPTVDAIAQEVTMCGADLVVGGSHGRTGMERVFLGSVMERLIGQIACPGLAITGG